MWDEAICYLFMIVTGAPVAVLTWLDGARFTAGSTLCLLLFVFGLFGLADIAARRSVPSARALRSRSRAAQVVHRREPG